MAFYPIWKDRFLTSSKKYFRLSGGVDPATNTADGIVFYSGAFPTAGGGQCGRVSFSTYFQYSFRLMLTE